MGNRININEIMRERQALQESQLGSKMCYLKIKYNIDDELNLSKFNNQM